LAYRDDPLQEHSLGIGIAGLRRPLLESFPG